MKKILITLGLIAMLTVSGATTALAVQTLDSAFLPKGLPTLSGNTQDFAQTADEARVLLTQRILNIVMGTAGVAATFFIVLSGFTLVTSAGSDDKIGQAKKSITWALVGLIAIVVSYSVISYVIKLGLLADDPNAAADRAALPQESQNAQNAIDHQNELDAKDPTKTGTDGSTVDMSGQV